MKKQSLLTIMLCFFFLSIFPNQSKALSCAELELEYPVIDQFDAAIVGTVLNVKNDIVQPGFTGPKEMKKYVLIEVERSWRHEFSSQLIFETDFGWGYNFEKRKKNLIYLSKNNGIYSNSACSPVSIVNSSSEYQEILGEGLIPKEQVNLGYKMWFMFDKDLDHIFVLGLLVILVIVLWKTYSKRVKSKR